MKNTLLLSVQNILTNKRIVVLSLIIFTTFILLAPIVATLTSQKDKVEVEYLSGADDPVEIVSLKIGNISITRGNKTFVAGDLIKNFTATVKNKRKQSINYVALGVIVVRPIGQENLPPFTYTVFSGNRMKALKKEQSGLEISPESNNNQTDLFLPDEEYLSIRASLDRLGYPPKIEKLIVQLDEVAFTDGTIWSIGSYYRTDPNDSKQKLIPLSNVSNEKKTSILLKPILLRRKMNVQFLPILMSLVP